MAKKNRGMCVQPIRVDPTTWLKLQWLAELRGSTRAAVVRCLLNDAVRGVKPPVPQNTVEIGGTIEEVEAWTTAAAKMDTTVPLLMRKVLNGLVEKTSVR